MCCTVNGCPASSSPKACCARVPNRHPRGAYGAPHSLAREGWCGPAATPRTPLTRRACRLGHRHVRTLQRTGVPRLRAFLSTTLIECDSYRGPFPSAPFLRWRTSLRESSPVPLGVSWGGIGPVVRLLGATRGSCFQGAADDQPPRSATGAYPCSLLPVSPTGDSD
jgi:hypothetical protein